MKALALLLAGALWLPTTAAAEGEDTNLTVVTAADIERERPADLVELLRAKVGLDDSGGTLTMRGVRGIAVFVDGFPSTLSDLKQVKPEQTERIDILRGAASARFGADAMGGAITVATRKVGTRPRFELVQGLNSAGSWSTRLSGTRDAAGGSIGISGERQYVHGYRRVPAAPYPSQVTVEDEVTHKESLEARAGFRGAGREAQLQARRFRSLSRYGRPNWWEDYETDTLRLTSSFRPSPAVELELSLGYERYRDKGLRDRGTGTDGAGLAPDRWLINDGDKLEGEGSATGKGALGTLRLGMRYGRTADAYQTLDYLSGATDFRLRAKLANLAAYFLYESKPWNGLSTELGGRYDRYRYYDTAIFNAASLTPDTSGAETVKRSFSPKAALRWTSNGTTLNGSVGTGFIPPTPDQLYYSDIGPAAEFLANPALQPQRSLTWDLGVRRKFGDATEAGVTLFHTLWRDKIGVMIVDYGIPLKRQFQNIGQAESKGAEVDLRHRMAGGWSAFFNYTHTRTRVTENLANPALVGKELPDMPRHKFNLGIGYEGARGLTAKALLRYVGASFTDENNTVTDARGYRWKRAPYSAVDVSLTRRYKDADLTLAVDNLFDRRYQHGFFWVAQGRVARAEATIRF